MILGDAIVLLLAIVSLIYVFFARLGKKMPLYFQLIISAVGCHFLGHLFDVCELFTTGGLSDGFTIGYLGSIGCFLFLLTANVGYMDGILDDKTAGMKKSRFLALIAPAVAMAMLIPNFFADVLVGTKVCYVILWIPATISSYYHLKHAIIPDMDFGFVKAIRPFNYSALLFTFFQMVHLTFWNFFGWTYTLLSGILLGASCILMLVAATNGVKKWTL